MIRGRITSKMVTPFGPRLWTGHVVQEGSHEQTETGGVVKAEMILERYESVHPQMVIDAVVYATAHRRGYQYNGKWIVAPTDGCTCGTGDTMYGHEPGCGLEPIAERKGSYIVSWPDKRTRPRVSLVCPRCGVRVTEEALFYTHLEPLGVLRVSVMRFHGSCPASVITADVQEDDDR